MSFTTIFAAGFAATIMGGALLLGASIEPRQAQQQIEVSARQQRLDAAWASPLQDGFDVEGRPLVTPPSPAKLAPADVRGDLLSQR